MPQPNSVQARGELLLAITRCSFDVWIEGTSGATVASIGARGNSYDKALGVWIDCIDFPACLLLPYLSLNMRIHMIERGGRKEDIAPVAGVKEQSIVHGNERSITNPSCSAAVAAQSRKAKSDRWSFR